MSSFTWSDMTPTLLFTAVYEMYPSSSFEITGDGTTYEDIQWNDTIETKPTKAAVFTKAQDLNDNWELWLCRKRRDLLLEQTDWWANSDVTMTQAQTTYRQNLRDITNGFTDLASVTWPTKP